MGRNDALRPWLSFVKANEAYGEPSKRAPARVMHIVHMVHISFMPKRPIILVVTPIAPFQII